MMNIVILIMHIGTDPRSIRVVLIAIIQLLVYPVAMYAVFLVPQVAKRRYDYSSFPRMTTPTTFDSSQLYHPLGWELILSNSIPQDVQLMLLSWQTQPLLQFVALENLCRYQICNHCHRLCNHHHYYYF